MDKTSLSSEVSAVQTKMLYLHYKTIKINSNIRRIVAMPFGNYESPEAITTRGEITYDLIDAVALFENYYSFTQDFNRLNTLIQKAPKRLIEQLRQVKRSTARWKHVRNKIGGHVDIEPVVEFCKNKNYQGVFISNHLEADFKGILLVQMLEAAVNSTMNKSKLFDNQLVLTQPKDLARLISAVNSDWTLCLELFNPVLEFLYEVGKKEKMDSISLDDVGIIKF